MSLILKRSSILLFIFTLLFATSCGQQPTGMPSIPGVKGPFLSVVDGSILISFEFEQINIPVGGRFPIPKMKNSYIEVSPAQTSLGTFMQVTLDFEDIESPEFRFVDPEFLPGGRPLPGIVGGSLPAVAVNLPSFLDTTFYVGQKVFGFFIPFELRMDGMFTYRLYLENKFLGNISLVGQDEQKENSGLLLLFNLNPEGKRLLKNLVEKSKKKKKRWF